MSERYWILTTEREANLGLVYFDEHRPGLARRRGRWCIDAFGRYWQLPRPRRWLRRAWRRLAR